MSIADRYLDLLELTLTGAILGDHGYVPGKTPQLADSYDEGQRLIGRDWPQHAHTMIGLQRLRHLRGLVSRVLAEEIAGDMIETGVWRGGACIFMRAILEAYGARDRRVWVADSFAGLPPPDADRYPADRDSWLHTVPMLAVSLEEVRRNFEKYGLLDDQVIFLKGWFRDTLPTAPIGSIALLRLDGDLYESTMDSLTALYGKVSPHGFIVIDDYNIDFCRQAVTDFLTREGITIDLHRIDHNAVFWQKPA